MNFGVFGFLPTLIFIIIIANIIKTVSNQGKTQNRNTRFNSSIESLKNEVMNELNSAMNDKERYKNTTAGRYRSAGSYRSNSGNSFKGSSLKGNTASAYRSSSSVRKTPAGENGSFHKAKHLINEEISDANRIWAIEQAKMNDLNVRFNEEIERQHAENRKLIAQAMRTDR